MCNQVNWGGVCVMFGVLHVCSLFVRIIIYLVGKSKSVQKSASPDWDSLREVCQRGSAKEERTNIQSKLPLWPLLLLLLPSIHSSSAMRVSSRALYVSRRRSHPYCCCWFRFASNRSQVLAKSNQRSSLWLTCEVCYTFDTIEHNKKAICRPRHVNWTFVFVLHIQTMSLLITTCRLQGNGQRNRCHLSQACERYTILSGVP